VGQLKKKKSKYKTQHLRTLFMCTRHCNSMKANIH